MALSHAQARAVLLAAWPIGVAVFRAPPTAAQAQAAQAVAFALSGYGANFERTAGNLLLPDNWGAPAFLPSFGSVCPITSFVVDRDSAPKRLCVADQGNDFAAAQAFVDVISPLFNNSPAAATDPNVLAAAIRAPPFMGTLTPMQLILAATTIAAELGETLLLGAPQVTPGGAAPGSPQIPPGVGPMQPFPGSSQPKGAPSEESDFPTWAKVALGFAATGVVLGAGAVIHNAATKKKKGRR